MVDLKEECLSVSGDEQNTSQSSSSQSGGGEIKSCTGCSTTTTPLWRGGPAGPKTLCNACGIKYHKKRRALMGIENGKMEKAKSKKKIKIRTGGIGSNGQQGKSSSSVRIPLKFKVVMNKFNGSGDEFLANKHLGEEEQAALLLMALSCGSVYA